MMSDWTFFSNHGHVLFCLDKNNRARLRDVALQVGITERAVQKIVRDMQEEGFLTVTKQGRCNRYRINKRKALRHELESQCRVGQMLALTARRARQDYEEADYQTDGDRRAGQAQKAEQVSAVEQGRQAEPKEEAGQAEQLSAEKKTEPEIKPLDTRQQGSLF